MLDSDWTRRFAFMLQIPLVGALKMSVHAFFSICVCFFDIKPESEL